MNSSNGVGPLGAPAQLATAMPIGATGTVPQLTQQPGMLWLPPNGFLPPMVSTKMCWKIEEIKKITERKIRRGTVLIYIIDYNAIYCVISL